MGWRPHRDTCVGSDCTKPNQTRHLGCDEKQHTTTPMWIPDLLLTRPDKEGSRAVSAIPLVCQLPFSHRLIKNFVMPNTWTWWESWKGISHTEFNKMNFESWLQMYQDSNNPHGAVSFVSVMLCNLSWQSPSWCDLCVFCFVKCCFDSWKPERAGGRSERAACNWLSNAARNPIPWLIHPSIHLWRRLSVPVIHTTLAAETTVSCSQSCGSN